MISKKKVILELIEEEARDNQNYVVLMGLSSKLYVKIHHIYFPLIYFGINCRVLISMASD